MPKQPIDFIFSPYRRQMLAVLLLRPDERFHVRQLERMTGVSAGSLHRELKAMAGAGLLLREQQGNQVLYQANRACPLYPELASIFRKTLGLASIMRDALKGVEHQIEFACVFGSMAAGSQNQFSDVDLLALGSVALIDVVKAVSSVQPELGRELNPVVMTVEKFQKLLEEEDRFATRVLSEPRIMIIGEDDEFTKLVEHRAA